MTTDNKPFALCLLAMFCSDAGGVTFEYHREFIIKQIIAPLCFQQNTNANQLVINVIKDLKLCDTACIFLITLLTIKWVLYE